MGKVRIAAVCAAALALGLWACGAVDAPGGALWRSADAREPAAPELPEIQIAWHPDRPVQGTLLQLIVRPEDGTGDPDAIAEVRGEFAGEPLHFVRDRSGAYRALAGLPITVEDSIQAAVFIEDRAGGIHPRFVWLPVAAGEYRHERLTVAPRYGTQPTPEIAERIAREAEQAREVSRRSHDTPRLWQGAFLRPRDSRITSGFGHGREFNGEVQSRHMGVDFAGAVGAPVRATNRGVAALVADFYLAGTAVYIDHGGGLVTGYFHLSKAEVAQGDTVEAGQIIGRVGATGRVTGPHLHWIARYGTVTVNPLSLLELDPADWPEPAPAAQESADWPSP